MKHVIVIETPDDIYHPLPTQLQQALMKVAEIGCEMEGITACVRGRFNEPSAIAAVHEMYFAPKWDPLAEGIKFVLADEVLNHLYTTQDIARVRELAREYIDKTKTVVVRKMDNEVV